MLTAKRFCSRSPVTCATLILTLLLLFEPLAAQYFGRNKVQYEQFDFEVTRTEHIDVYHDAQRAEIKPVVEDLIAGRLPQIREDQVCGGGGGGAVNPA